MASYKFNKIRLGCNSPKIVVQLGIEVNPSTFGKHMLAIRFISGVKYKLYNSIYCFYCCSINVVFCPSVFRVISH